MVSVNTNAAAITALRTLQQTNATLDKTQNRISTGLKIGEAKDNAAYWAISTTLKSDNKSLGTVKDALGLGGSTVDVAYQGLNKAKDVLDEIKSKLTAATQDGVNRDTIQNEIKQLQDQLKSIATSSIFSGENWLAVDTSVAGFNPEKQVVASFSREQNGSVTIGTIKVQTATVALFDASTALNSGGIIDGAMNLKGKDGRDLTIGGTDVTTGNASVAGLTATAATGVAGGAATPTAATTLGGAGAKALVSTGNLTLSEYAPGDRITIKLNVNGTTTTITTAALAPAGASLALTDVASALDTALTGIANVAVNGTALDIEADANGTKTVFSLAQFTLRDANGKVKTATNTPAATAASYETGSFTSVTLDKDDGLYFRVQADDATAATNVAINRDLIDKALANVSGHVSGKIDNAAQFKTVLDAALAAANIKNVNTKVTSTDKITFSTDSVGTDSKLIVSDLQASQGGDTISVETIDISTSAAAFAGKTSTEIKQILSAYIDVVNTAINKVTSAAGLLGSVASRIDMQKGFVDTLMDTIDKGVGNLIDADMSEESTRLQALQVKQQLGVQALSIANQSSQNILSLFQSSR